MPDERYENRAAEGQTAGIMGVPANPCDGNPAECEFAQSLIAGAIGAWQEESYVAQLRAQLSQCAPCLLALDAEINLRRTLQAKSQDRAPQNLRIHISRTLGRISLDGITEADL